VCDHTASGFNGLHGLVKDVVWCVFRVSDDDGLLRDQCGKDSHDDREEHENRELHGYDDYGLLESLRRSWMIFCLAQELGLDRMV
jgi:hypothetical protein